LRLRDPCILLARHQYSPVDQLPTRLAKDPIVEALFEFRFEGKGAAVAEILQGYVFTKFRDRFPKIQRNPIAEFTAAFANDPTLRYQPHVVLRADAPPAAIALGPSNVIINHRKPYIGWRRFKPLILEVLGQVRDADVVAKSERISMKYANLIPGDTHAEQFLKVHHKATLGRKPYDLTTLLTHVRTEVQVEGLTCIIELKAGTIANLPTGAVKGLLLTVDTLLPVPSTFLEDIEDHLEKVHRVEKTVFFDVLTDPTIQSFEPEWE
jgi:uncharacterized protein (TIGR04255 family)